MNIKTIGIAIIALALIGYGIFSYITRPLAAPTNTISQDVTHIETSGTKADTQVLSIVSSESQAAFSLNEDLYGKLTLVVGTTNQVAGEIKFVQSSPATLSIGEIKINARTFKTDNEKRNATIGRMILKSEEAGNEYITFKTTSVTGLPTAIETGKEFSYKVTGDLTIRGTTKSVTFDAKSTVAADGSLKATAKTTVTYGDYGISIPDFPFLANVDKTTELSISVVAR